MLLYVDTLVVVSVFIVLMITRELIYRKSDQFFKKYVGLFYAFGVLSQIIVGFVVYHNQISNEYFYLFPVEFCYLAIIYEYLMAKKHYSNKISQFYAGTSIALMGIYFVFVCLGWLETINIQWLYMGKFFLLLAMFVGVFKNFIYLSRDNKVDSKTFSFAFTGLLAICFYCIFILVILIFQEKHQTLLYLNKTVMSIGIFTLLMYTVYHQIRNQEINDPKAGKVRVNTHNVIDVVKSDHVNKTFDNTKVQPEKYEKSKLKSSEIEIIRLKIEKELIYNQAFLDPDLCLQTFSEMIKTSKHNISQVFSLYFESNFKEYVNRLRCEFAIDLLAEPNGKHIIEIAYESGFNSKTSFYRAFNKNFNISPTEYKSKNDELN